MTGRRLSAQIEAEDYGGVATESQWQVTVVDAAKSLGWVVVHVRNMIANEPGIPDLLMFRGDRYLAVELKTETGKVSIKQQMWHERLAAAGGRVHVWRPADWDIVQEVLR